MINETEIQEAYNQLVLTRGKLYDAESDLRRAKESLKDAEMKLLLDGKIDGKNAELRAAALRENTSHERLVLFAAEVGYDLEKRNYEIDKFKVGMNDQLLRLMEIEKGGCECQSSG